jgi:hypothetical protein
MNLLKKIIFCFVFGAVTVQLPPQNSLQAQQPNSTAPQSQEPQLDNKTAHLLLTILATEIGAIYYASSNQKQWDNFKHQLTLQELAPNLIITFIRAFLTTAGHEFGHALAAKILSDSKIDVHIGATSQQKSQGLIKLPGLTIDKFDPNSGYSNYKIPATNADQVFQKIKTAYCKKHKIDETKLTSSDILEALQCDYAQELKKELKPNKLKNSLILLAGPIAGLLTNFLLRTIEILVKNKMALNFATHSSSLKAQLLNALTQAIIPDALSVYELSVFFTPQTNSDGGKLLALTSLSPNKLKKLNAIADILAPFIHLGAQIGREFLFENQNAGANILQKSVIGLVNYLLLGYLNFHA